MKGDYAQVPYGTLVIKETKAPAGYEVSDDTWLVTFTEGSDGNVVRTWYDGKGNKLGTAAGVSVGNTRDPGTAAILEPVENPTLKTTALDKTTGLHEGNYQGDKTVVKDTVSIGKIVKGQTYTVRGTLMDKDTGKALKDADGKKITAEKTFTATKTSAKQTLSFTVDGSIAKGKEIVVYERLYWMDGNEEVLRASHTNIGDVNQTVTYPIIGTMATDKATGTHEGNASAETVTVNDAVAYSGLIVGNKYTIKGTLMDGDTGLPLKDVDGGTITKSKTFTAKESDGTLNIRFTVPGSIAMGKSIVVFEDLYSQDKLIVAHEDLTDTQQTVNYPEIHTSACDDITRTDEGYAGVTVNITDTVSYGQLTIGSTYTLKGVLMDKATGKQLTDGDGNPITGMATFTAEDSTGTIDVHFSCDGSLVEGRSVVVFEELYSGDLEKPVAEHKDINDASQIVTYPGIHTTALDGITCTHEGLAEGTVTVNDTVSYTGLKAEEIYTITGTLYDKATGKALLDTDGKAITVTKEFTAEDTTGETTVTFEVPAELVAGKHIVAFETCSRDGNDIAVHADIKDADQTVTYPEMDTVATDMENGTHFASTGDTVTITDAVSYKGLTPGHEYILGTTFVNGATGESIAIAKVKEAEGTTDIEKDVTSDSDTIAGEKTDAEKEGTKAKADVPEDETAAPSVTTVFIPESESGTAYVTFTVNRADILGTPAVVFEKIYASEDGEKTILIGNHSDITDEDQTIYIPEIGTTATDAATGEHEGLADGTVTINDTVSYKALKAGEEYTVTGTLMNKATGKAIPDKDGKAVTSSVTFTAKESDGEVEVVFEVPSELVAGKKVVAFETVTYEGLEIAIHSDIEDEGQTVSYPAISTTAKDARTGSKMVLKEQEMQITDTVKFTNLIPGQRYRLAGTLYDTETGKAITVGGKTVQAAGYFKTDKTNGTAAITFTFDGTDLNTDRITVFEKLYAVYTDKDGSETLKEVAHHEDLTDTSQTVSIPSLGTKASVNGGNSAVANGTVTVKDTVSYKGLVRGETYKVSGTLMDKSTGKALIVNGKAVTGETVFTAASESGTAEVTFVFDATGLGGKSLVVFEKLYLVDNGTDKEIGHHEDLTDSGQTVSLTAPVTPPQTGDGTPLGAMMVLMSIGVAGLVFVIIRRRKA